MLRVGSIVCLAMLAGCHGPSVTVSRPSPRPSGPNASLELPAVAPMRIEPSLGNVPALDARSAEASKLFAANGAGFRGLNEPACLSLAATHSPIGNLLDRENEKPSISVLLNKKDCPDRTRDELLRELRFLAATEQRHRDASEALDRYFQLADAEARTELLSAGLKSFDELRTLAPRFRAAGLPTPDEDDLTRQRAKILVDIEAAEAGIKLLNVDLQSRLGLSIKGAERLWPMGPFEIEPTPVDAEAAVQVALANRADLRLLRTLYHGTNAATVPVVGEQLKTFNALAGATAPPVSRLLLESRSKKLESELKAAATHEVEIRKGQLFELTAVREKLAAAEVRTSALQMASTARRVALAKGRADSWREKVEKAAKEEKLYDRLPMELEWYRARAEVVQEVMAWHRWHAKFRAAQGAILDSPGEKAK